MANAWAIVAMMIFALDFFFDAFSAGSSLINVIYPAVLTIYTGSKELNRWQRKKSFRSRFFGEGFVIIWTLLFFAFTIISAFSNGRYRVSLEMVTTYIAVLSIYAVTLKSKAWRQ